MSFPQRMIKTSKLPQERGCYRDLYILHLGYYAGAKSKNANARLSKVVYSRVGLGVIIALTYGLAVRIRARLCTIKVLF